MKKNTKFKILKIFISLLIITIFTILTINSSFIKAQTNKVILGGQTIGLKIDTGVCIAGKYSVETEDGKVNPWKNSDIKEGDKIIYVDDYAINSNQELLKILKLTSNDYLTLTISRNDKTFKTKVDIVKTTNNNKSIGLYIKDRLIGIGTMTFIEPTTKRFAALGHGIYDKNQIITTSAGDITSSSIEGIKKAVPGSAGEKRASINKNQLGIIKANKLTGVYGIVNQIADEDNLIEVAKQEEVKLALATIYTVIDKNKVEAFNIRITNVDLQNNTNIKGIKYEVIDKKLLEKTGGIIQGMSGSPIVQNNKIIGAVSHVLVDEPSIGYGIHIEWMLKDANMI